MIVSRFEEMADMDHKFKIHTKDGMMKLQSTKEGRKGLLKIDAEIFEVAPMLHVIEVKKASGDTLEYNDFCNKELKPALRDIVWSMPESTIPVPVSVPVHIPISELVSTPTIN